MIIDINVNFGTWPFRRFQINDLKKIEKKLKINGIKYAFISHIGGVLNFQEVEEYNEQLYKKIKNQKFFIFVPIVNLNLPDADEKIEKYRLIKIVPTYHFYSLNDKKLIPLFKKISDKKIIIFLQMRYEDERSHNPLFKIDGLEIEEIKKFALEFPEIKIIILCGYFNEIIQLCKIENIYSDISFVENYKTIKSLLNEISSSKILFGSHMPFFYIESEIAKLKYAEIEKEDLKKISYKNAFSIIGI
ncbi:MAG: amidohydrolase family protein [Candidatus Ratteibacteria bacterium]